MIPPGGKVTPLSFFFCPAFGAAFLVVVLASSAAIRASRSAFLRAGDQYQLVQTRHARPVDVPASACLAAAASALLDPLACSSAQNSPITMLTVHIPPSFHASASLASLAWAAAWAFFSCLHQHECGSVC